MDQPVETIEDVTEAQALTRLIRLDRLLGAGLVTVAVIACASAVIIAAAHVADRYLVDQSPGVLMALAWLANAGELYPPPFDGEHFGGTRYMPLHLILHALVANATGEYLISGKIITYAAATVMLALLFQILRRQRCSIPVSMALTTAIVCTSPGLLAVGSIRGDGLGLCWQLAALLVISRSQRPIAAATAGLLCALGILTKMSAVWAPAAIALWLMWADRRSLLVFASALGIPFLVVLGSLHLLTDGRITENLFGLSVSGIGGLGAIVLWSPERLIKFFNDSAPVLWFFVPLAVFSIVVGIAERRLSVYHLAFVCLTPVLAVLYADVGVGKNHLIDLLAISVILIGDLWSRSNESIRQWSQMQRLIAVALVCVNSAGFMLFHWTVVRDAAAALYARETMQPYHSHVRLFAERIPKDELILSEDPAIPISLNRRPVVLDSFMLLRMDEAQPGWSDSLIDRIEAHQFDKIILTHPSDPESWWYRRLFFGERVIRTILNHYVQAEEVAEYRIFVPRARP